MTLIHNSIDNIISLFAYIRRRIGSINAMLTVGFYGKSRFTFPGIRIIKNLFPGIPEISGGNFYFIYI